MGRSRTVKDLLKHIKHYASVAVDLAFYSLVSEDAESAVEILKIENEIDRTFEELMAKVAVAVRSPDDADIAVAVANLGRSLDKVSDAAGDLAGLVLRKYPIHPYVKAAVNCCSEIVALLRARKGVRDIPGIVDLLVVRRGESYMLAPSLNTVEKGDVLVVRGMMEEIKELANLLGDSEGATRLVDREGLIVMEAGDELAESVVRIKMLARSAIDLAFHSLVYGDPSLTDIIRNIEDDVDTLYHKILESSYAASSPQSARELVSISIFASAMEQLADASIQMARIVEEEGYLSFVGEAIEESEEAYLRVQVTDKAAGRKISDYDFADMGINIIALGRRGSWIIPVRQDYTLKEGDILLLKYFKPKGEESEERVESLLEQLGFEVLEE